MYVHPLPTHPQARRRRPTLIFFLPHRSYCSMSRYKLKIVYYGRINRQLYPQKHKKSIYTHKTHTTTPLLLFFLSWLPGESYLWVFVCRSSIVYFSVCVCTFSSYFPSDILTETRYIHIHTQKHDTKAINIQE